MRQRASTLHSTGPLHRPGTAGMTVLELLIGTTITASMALGFFSVMQTWPARVDLRGSADRAAYLISQARLEAIQRGVTTVVEADLDKGELRAYADVNGNPRASDPGYAHYLKYDPYWVDGVYDPTLGLKQTDYEIGSLRLERSFFAAPEDLDPVEGLTQIPGAPPGTTPVLVFSSTGVADNAGALRFGDRTGYEGAPRNYLEAAIVSLTGKVETRKYLLAEDSPTSSAGFFPEGRMATGENLWVWY